MNDPVVQAVLDAALLWHAEFEKQNPDFNPSRYTLLIDHLAAAVAVYRATLTPTCPDGSAAVDELPTVAIDAAGYWWRVFGDFWSMVPTNPDNAPVPQPAKFYRLVGADV